MRAYIGLRERVLDAPSLRAEVRPFLGDRSKVVDFYVHLMDEIKGRAVGPLGPGEPIRGLIYVELDSPRLGNLDWSAPIRRSIDEIASQRLGTVINLPKWELAIGEPSFVEEAPTKTRYSLRNSLRNAGPRSAGCESAACAEDVYVVKSLRVRTTAGGG
jgi:hypothetical protein